MTATISRIHVVSEGVVASYIHDISSRSASRRPPVKRVPEPRRREIRPPTGGQELLSSTAK